jgi:hypothetical protein
MPVTVPPTEEVKLIPNSVEAESVEVVFAGTAVRGQILTVCARAAGIKNASAKDTFRNVVKTGFFNF